jgi:Flp pilus assembly protein TadB
VRNALDGALGGRRAQVPLAVFSLLVAGALVVADLVDGNAVGGPIGVVIAAFLLLNAGVRIVLWRAAERR